MLTLFKMPVTITVENSIYRPRSYLAFMRSVMENLGETMSPEGESPMF